MKEKIIITKSSKKKAANYQRNSDAFENLRFREVGKPWTVVAYKDVRSFLEKTCDVVLVHGSRIVRYTDRQLSKVNWSLLGRCTYRSVRWVVLKTKDAVLLTGYLAVCLLQFTFEVLGGTFLFFLTLFKASPRPQAPPQECEWWSPPSESRHSQSCPRSCSRPRRRRVTRVTVEIEEMEW